MKHKDSDAPSLFIDMSHWGLTFPSKLVSPRSIVKELWSFSPSLSTYSTLGTQQHVKLKHAVLKAKSSPTEANERLGAVQVVDPQDANDKSFVLVGIICVLSCVTKIFFLFAGCTEGEKATEEGDGRWVQQH